MNVKWKHWFISLFVFAGITPLCECQVCKSPCQVTFTCAMVRVGNGDPEPQCISMQEAIMLNNALQGGPTGPGTGTVVQTPPVNTGSNVHSHDTSGGVLTHSHHVVPGPSRGGGGGGGRHFGSNNVEVTRDFGRPGLPGVRPGSLGPFQFAETPPQSPWAINNPLRLPPGPGRFVPMPAFASGPLGPMNVREQQASMGQMWPLNQRGSQINTQLTRDPVPGLMFGRSNGLDRSFPNEPLIQETFIQQANMQPPNRLPQHQILPNNVPQHRIPPNNVPQHHIPPNSVPQHRIPPNSVPQHRIPPNSVPQHRIPPNSVPQHRIPPNSVPQHRIPPNSVPQHHIPHNSVQQGIQPNIVAPNQIPPNQLPRNRVPVNQAPVNRAPPPSNNQFQGESWVVGSASVMNQGQAQSRADNIRPRGELNGGGVVVTTPSIAERFNVSTMRPREEVQGQVSNIRRDEGGRYFMFFPHTNDNGIRVNITKHGFCRRNPRTRERNFCMNMCYSDDLCPRTLKCCPSGCSLSCIEPVT